MNTVDINDDAIGDQAEFHDYGTIGQSRPQVHVIPSFAVREYWLHPNNGNLFAVSGATTAPVGSIIINVSLELESVPLTTGPTLRNKLRTTSIV
jgi:hypothetical protein